MTVTNNNAFITLVDFFKYIFLNFHLYKMLSFSLKFSLVYKVMILILMFLNIHIIVYCKDSPHPPLLTSTLYPHLSTFLLPHMRKN